ncbi:MAG: hypothetical protein V4719_24605 [Planctomycetota bacterium]
MYDQRSAFELRATGSLLVRVVCLSWLALLSFPQLVSAQQPAPVAPVEPPGRRVFVPLEELQTLIQRDRNWVLLSRDEFQKLYAEAKSNTLDKPVPPQAVGVRDVKYTARIDEDQLVISAKLQVTKFVAGWQMLPLDFRDLALEKATLGDQPAKLGRDPQAGGQLVLLLDQVGTQTLTLELSRPLAAVGSDKMATFGLAPLWAAEFTLEVPPQKHLQWNGVAVERPAANDQPATFNLAFGGQKQVVLRITDRPTEQSSEGLVFAHTTMGLRASPEEVTWQAVTSLQVFGKPLDRVQLRVPVGLQIISITSPGLESWEFGPKTPDAPETILDLRYRQPFQEPRDVTLRGVLATKSGESWQVPNLKLAGVASHVTQVLVTNAPGIRLQLDEIVGAQRTAAEEPKEAPAAAVVAGLQFSAWREDFALRFTTLPKAREVSAALVTLLDINSSGLDLQCRATIEAKFAPLFDVSLALPAEWTVNDVLVNQQRVAWESVPQEAGTHLLRVAFENPLPANQPAIIQLSAHLDPKDWPLEDGSVTFPLPEVRVLHTNAVEGTVVVAAERDLDVQPQELKGLAPMLLDQSLSARLSYEYQDTHYSGKVLVLRRPSRVSARTLAFHRLDQETFLSHLEARLTIEGGGPRKLQVSLPESAGTSLRFELAAGKARIVEQTSAVPENGRRLWTLSLDQRAFGDVLLLVDVAQPRKEAKEFVPPSLQVIGAERETGQIAFEAESDQQLDIVATAVGGVPLTDVDATDLTVPTAYSAKERIIAAYGYVLPGYQTKLTERRFSRMPVPTAICDQLTLVSILGETGELQHEATFQIRAVGVQSLQITLPERAQLWATLIDGEPIEVRRTKTAYLVPLKTSAATDTEAVEDPSRVRTLKLFYRTEVGPLTAASTFRQTPPGITVLNGDGSEQPLEILQQAWTVHHPVQTEFVADPGNFLADHPALRSGFLGDLLRSFQVDSPRNLFWKAVTLLIAGGVIWLLGLLWRKSGAQGLASLAIALFVGGMLVSLFLPAVQSARESSPTAKRNRQLTAAPETSEAIAEDEFKSVGGVDRPAAAPLSSKDGFRLNKEHGNLNSQFGDFLPSFGGNRNFGVDQNKSVPAAATPAAEAPVVGGFEVAMQPKSAKKPGDEQPGKAMPENAPNGEGVPQTQEKGPAGPKDSNGNKAGNPSSESDEKSGQPQVDRPVREPEALGVDMGQPVRRRAAGQDLAQAPQPAKPNENRKAVADGVDPFAPPVAQAAPPFPIAPNRKDLNGLASGKAVLSLALTLEPPAGTEPATYTYRGRLQKTPPELVIGYQNRARLSFVVMVFELAMILLCWWTRRWSFAVRGLILALGIGMPFALMTVIPATWLPFLDGILAGTVLGTLLWIIYAVCQWSTSENWWKLMNQPLSTSASILLAVTLAMGSSTVQADEKPAQVVTKPAVIAPHTPVIDADTLVIPFDGATDPLKSNRVLLPHAKFVELWRQAHPEDPEIKNSPVAATIAEALYAAELVPAVAGGKAAVKVVGRFACYSFRDSQVTLPLPLGKVAVTGAQLDGAAAPLVAGTEQNPLAVLISKPGLHVVDLQFTVPAQLTGPAGLFSLPLTDVTSGLLRFKAPAGDFNFRVNGSSGAFRRIGADAAAELLIPVGAGGAFQVSWQPRQNRADVAGVVHVESTSAVLLSQEGPRLLSHWIYQVRQGSLSEIVFSLPDGLAVRKIAGQDVGGWEVGGEGEARQLKIFLRRKVEDSTQLEFDLFLKQPADDLETTYQIPQFAPQNITRETGTLAVLAEKQFAVRVGNISGLAQIEPQQVPLQRLKTEQTLSPSLAYRFANRPYQLDLIVNRRQPQLKVAGRHYGNVDPRKVQQQNRFQFRLLGAPRAGVSLLLPQGYLLQDVQAPEIADWHISGRDDSADMAAEALLHLEFAAPRTGNFEVVLIGKTLRQPEELKAEISLPYPLETDELDTQLLTTLDPIYTGSPAMLDNWKSIDPAELARQFGLSPLLPNQLGFSSQTPAPAPVQFELRQAQPRLSGQVLTLLSVGEDSLDYLFALRWNISTAGADTFVFTTPEWLAGKLDFPEGNGPRRRGVTHEPTGDGRTRWTISLEDPQRENYFIVARTVLPPSAKGEVSAPGVVLEQVIPGQDPPQINPLETQTQYVVLVNQSQTQLTSLVPDAVETIPADDLVRVIKIRQDLIDQAAEIVRVRTTGAGVTWKQQRFQAEQLLPAAVNLAHHVTVLAPDGSWREQVTYRLRNRKRQFLAVNLPDNSQVLSLFVKGQPARPVLPTKGTGFTLIPLPKTVEGDVSFEVQLVLAGQLSSGPLPRGWGLSRQQIDVPIPSVVAPEESAEYGIPVSQTTWTVYAPRDLDLDILKRSSLTNVHEVTETLQLFDQSASVLSDVSELIAINGSTYNRRAKAQSLTNLKQLKGQLSNLANNQSVQSAAEAAKQQELRQRADQLQQSIDKLVITNSEQGLTVQDDGAGNSIVLDQQAQQGNAPSRVSEFYADNTSKPTLQNSDGGLQQPLMAGDGKNRSGNKGNLDRGNLRGQNLSQIRELAVERQQKVVPQRARENEIRNEVESKLRSYQFRQSGSDKPFAGMGDRFSLPEQLAGAAQARQRGTRTESQIEQEITNLTQQFNDLLKERRHAEAGLLFKKARALYPENPLVEVMKWKMKFAQRNAGKPGQANDKAAESLGELDAVDWSAVPFDDRTPLASVKNRRKLRGLAVFDGGNAAPPTWTTSGGLSLLIDIPTDGQVYNFSKLSGGARLAVGVRPHQTWQFALGLVWTVMWLVILIVVAWTLSRPRALAALYQKTPWMLTALGIVTFFLIRSESGGAMFLSMAVFAVGAFWIAFQKSVKA